MTIANPDHYHFTSISGNERGERVRVHIFCLEAGLWRECFGTNLLNLVAVGHLMLTRLWTIHELWIDKSIPIPGFRWNWNWFFTILELFYSTCDSLLQKNWQFKKRNCSQPNADQGQYRCWHGIRSTIWYINWVQNTKINWSCKWKCTICYSATMSYSCFPCNIHKRSLSLMSGSATAISLPHHSRR